MRVTSRAILPTVVFLFLASSAYGQSAPGYQAPDKPKVKDDRPVAEKAARGEVPFSRKYGQLKAGATNTKRLGRLTATEQKKKKDGKFLRIGVVRSLKNPLDPLTDSALYTVAEGDVRVASVVSDGAVAVRVQFKDMSLPPGARVFVYSPTNPNEYFGPYVGRGPSQDGTFWTPAIQGDTAVIEYFTPAKTDAAKTPFKVFSIAHVYKDMSIEDEVGSCELEVTADWQNVAKSVGRVDFVSGGSVGTCTGTLLNDAASDQKPYFLTANHCISTQTEAQSVTVYWNYNTGDSPPGGTPQTHGANLLVTGATSDFTLLFLTGSLPGGLFFSGWDSSPFNATAAATAIHHPDGSHKRISFGTARQPLAGNCLPGEQCLRVDWTSGVTEPGSSGSGVWKGSPADPGGPRLIGNLTGGESACGAPQSSMWDVYGRFSVTYPSISSFLEGTACVTSLSPTSQTFGSAGGTGSITVTAGGTCNWTANTGDSFVTITSGANGSGNGTVNFSVASNIGPQRSATIVVGGQSFTITQGGGGPCEPTPISIGQTVNANLSTSDCPFGDGTFYDSYSFTGTAGQRVAVSMTSNEFDTYLFLNRPDGSPLADDDDGGGGTNSRIPSGGGFITLPVTGTYTIWANAFDASDTTGAYSLTLSVPIPRTITVASQNPNSGVSVAMTPTDNNGLSNGTTQFTRTYDQFTTVVLNAPGGLGGGIIFLKWLKDGADYSTSPVAVLTLDADHTLTAVYGPTPTFALTVASTNPGSGVSITVTPNDTGVSENATTSFNRTYTQFTQVNLKAPIDAGGTYFQKWQQDGVDVSTVRATSVLMNANHTMTAVYITLPPPPPPTPTPTPTGPGQAVGYQIDPAHTGFQFDTVTPPLTQRWSRNLGSSVSYPLIANGRVFVIAGTQIYALDGTTGATLWGPIDVGPSPRGLAYDSGRVFAVNSGGLLRAFDAATGNQAWSRQLGGQFFSSPPSASGGTVYVSGFSTMYAVNAQDGNIKWSVANAGGDQSSPAVTPNAIYMSYSCNNVWALTPATGNLIWHHTSSCFGGGGRTPVFYNSRVYARDEALENLALDAGTGTPVADFPTGPAPAFHGSTGFFVNVFPAMLQAKDISTGAVKWSFTGDGNISSAPIVVNGTVYVGSTGGKLFALDENTGANVWTGTVGASVNRPDEHNLSEPLTGLGAGEGLIVVPASNLVVAYQAAPVGPPTIYVEEGTNNAVALDSVTFVRGPFRLSDPNNFSSDHRTRLILLTSSLGLAQADLSDPTVLVVEAAGVNLPVESVGAISITGLNSSYIVVRLPDNAPTGVVELKVKLRGVASDARMLNILP